MDKEQISVSGLSSGAFFAVQFHVSFSKTIMGAGVIAGGTPHWPANYDVTSLDKNCDRGGGGNVRENEKGYAASCNGRVSGKDSVFLGSVLATLVDYAYGSSGQVI